MGMSMRVPFYLVFFAALLLIALSGIGAGFLALFGENPLSPAQEDLFNVLVWTFAGGSFLVLILLGAFLRLR